jgi:acyl-CoA reductase-like NAD-dependent aldehyde dehydrogenase
MRQTAKPSAAAARVHKGHHLSRQTSGAALPRRFKAPPLRSCNDRPMPSLETRLLINGEQVAGSGAPLEVENPYSEETIAAVGTPDEGQLDAAIAAASEAAASWAATPAVDRGELLHEVATRLRDRTDALAETMTLEGGKPLVENTDEVGWTAACFDYYAEIGRDSAGRVIPSIEASQLALVLKEPLGVIGCIVPWNYPLLLLAWKMAPALAAGNAVVCKPSELTPLSTLMLAPCLDHLPAGVVNLLSGAGDVGAVIASDPRVDGVAFTGSVETGKKVAHACVDRIARVNLEMGGKDPFIVCPDVADAIGVAAKGGAWAAFLNSGQVCTSAERFYVHRDVYDDYLSAFVEYTSKLVIGDPMQSGTDIGPMVSARQRQKVADQLEAAVGAGAEVVIGGDAGGQRSGHFFSPAVVTGAPAETELLREETFGPVAPLVPVKSLDEAIELANSTPYGLGANVYTQDFRTILRCMREVKAGTVWFNDPLTDNDAGPFGGFKQSGLGRELGREGLEAFQETKHVHIESEVAPKEWWYPYSEYAGGEPPHGA